MEGHTGGVCSVPVSEMETLIVCVLDDNSMQVWKKTDRVRKRTVLSYHTSSARFFAMNINRTQDVSGSLNPASHMSMQRDSGWECTQSEDYRSDIGSISVHDDGIKNAFGDDALLHSWKAHNVL